jgi:hypothetical protein
MMRYELTDEEWPAIRAAAVLARHDKAHQPTDRQNHSGASGVCGPGGLPVDGRKQAARKV